MNRDEFQLYREKLKRRTAAVILHKTKQMLVTALVLWPLLSFFWLLEDEYIDWKTAMWIGIGSLVGSFLVTFVKEQD